MIYVTWTVTVNPTRRDEVVDALNKISTTIRQEAGCISHRFYADLWDVDTVRLYTEFESLEALQVHGQSQHMQDWQVEKQNFVDTGAMVFNNDGGIYEAKPVNFK